MSREDQSIQRMLVVLPSWVGDVVMATPTLRALRTRYPDAHISYLVKSTIKPIIEGSPWYDRLIAIRPRKTKSAAAAKTKGRRSFFNLAGRIRKRDFDTAVLLPNSFRTALMAKTAKIPRRVGYDRDGRGFLLTDRLLPMREPGRYIPTPTLQYYLQLARYLDAPNDNEVMELHSKPEQHDAARSLLTKAGIDPDGGDQPVVLLNPGANYGAAKMWYPDRFAAVADKLIEQHNAKILVSGAPKERQILDAVHEAGNGQFIDLPSLGCDLGMLKSILRRCDLVLTNDTGPRHIAAAVNTPLITIFGPTDPRWSEINFESERKVIEDVFCGPCQKKACPLDHRCMTSIHATAVLEHANELLINDSAKVETTQQ